ncbi:hypothetical protein Plhal703r1_c13g0067391 [Plasmopara halstedii]
MYLACSKGQLSWLITRRLGVSCVGLIISDVVKYGRQTLTSRLLNVYFYFHLTLCFFGIRILLATLMSSLTPLQLLDLHVLSSLSHLKYQ